MAQTTSAFASANFKAEVSLDGSSWTDISGVANDVEVNGGDQQTGKQFTASGKYPVVVYSGKNDMTQVKFSGLYTETAGEGWAIVYARFIGAVPTIFFRYSPQGGATATKRYVTANAADTAAAAVIKTCLPPKVDSGSGDPAMFEFTLETPQMKQEAVP